MSKFLITLLTSYNEYILLNTYNSIKNQVEHNIDYEIVIIVNTLNPTYYYEVCNKFKNINVEIVKTESNGKPGMGHNSVINYFKENPQYDYLIPIDGDDFLYPQALHQLSKILIYNPTIVVGGNEDYISNFKELYNENNCYNLHHSYFLYTEPNICTNINFTLQNKGTPIRLIMLNKSLFTYSNELYGAQYNKYYCEESKVFDDYLFYLHVLNFYYITNCNVYYINLKNIYLYYKAHISSVCYQNSHNCKDDIIKMINKFHILKTLTNEKIKLKLPTLYISNYLSETLIYKKEKNGITYKVEDYKKSNEYRLNYNFASLLSKDLYESTLYFIKNKINQIHLINIEEKKKLYLILENLLLNNIINNNIINYILLISNNINFIAEDIIPIIDKNYKFSNNYKQEYRLNNFVSTYIITNKIIKEQTNVDKNIYYYYNISSIKTNLSNYSTVFNNQITLDNNKKTIILLDYMDIDYLPITPYKRGLGGTQSSYIFLGVELTNYFNVIILNKNKSPEIIFMNNIYTIKYNINGDDSNNNIINYINNINPSFVIYNFIAAGDFLRTNINKTIKLIMYEHICIYSNFEDKLKYNYTNYYDKILFISENQYNTYLKHHKIETNKKIILNNGLSPIFYNNTLSNLILQQKELSIIYISNPQRGLECFEYIFPLLKSRFPTIKLKIFSSLNMYDIEDNSSTKRLVERLIKIDGVSYKSSISQYELVEELNKSLLFIYPTFVEETFCNAMIEAMSCGCYVISTNIGALKEVANPFGHFINININKSPEHPYYESIDADYINNIVEKSSEIIDNYNVKNYNLECTLQKQIEFIKKKYNWKNQATKLYDQLF